MNLAKAVAMSVPAIRRLYEQRNDLIEERDRLATAAENRAGRFSYYATTFDPIETIKRHSREDLVADPRYLTNYLGVKIDPSYLPSVLADRAGTIEGAPIPANWHADIAEWGAGLRAVDLAGDTFRALELGCGWACWLNITGAAARRLGKTVELIGIEGDKDHVIMAVNSLSINGFKPDQFQIFHGIAAPDNGKALFPVVGDTHENWGSEPILKPTSQQLADAEKTGSCLILDKYMLRDLSGDRPLDLLHIDIQGGEVDFVSSNLDEITRLVRYMLIGTHSRTIEGDLMHLLLGAGWVLEMERAAFITITDGRPMTEVDGVQAWKNPRL